MMKCTWYWYKLGYWEMAVNAVSKKDADEHIKSSAPGAKYNGNFEPSRYNTGTATGMVTEKMQAVIHEQVERAKRGLD